MSKSLSRVRVALEAADVPVNIRETSHARTALDAAKALDCSVEQIGKSIVLQGLRSNEVVLFITAGDSRVDLDRAAALADQPLGKADAQTVRSQTGFAIGGVSPIGHLAKTRKWFDQKLLSFDIIWVAAGTPHHVFGLSPTTIMRISGAQLADFSIQSKKM